MKYIKYAIIVVTTLLIIGCGNDDKTSSLNVYLDYVGKPLKMTTTDKFNVDEEDPTVLYLLQDGSFILKNRLLGLDIQGHWEIRDTAILLSTGKTESVLHHSNRTTENGSTVRCLTNISSTGTHYCLTE